MASQEFGEISIIDNPSARFRSISDGPATVLDGARSWYPYVCEVVSTIVLVRARARLPVMNQSTTVFRLSPARTGMFINRPHNLVSRAE
jgi:hypothetical protein